MHVSAFQPSSCASRWLEMDSAFFFALRLSPGFRNGDGVGTAAAGFCAAAGTALPLSTCIASFSPAVATACAMAAAITVPSAKLRWGEMTRKSGAELG